MKGGFVMSVFIYEAIRELNEVLTDIEDIMKDTTLPTATVAKLTKVKSTIEDVESGLAHC